MKLRLAMEDSAMATSTVRLNSRTGDDTRSHALIGVAFGGSLLVVASVVILLGIITAEAFYSATYTTFENEISDLGATRPPNSVIYQPSATIFNLTMMVSGVFIAATALALHGAYHVKRVTITMAILGVAIFGVGVFPGNRDPWHGLFAMTAFVDGGLAAILCAKILQAPFRHLSILLGTITLGSLLVAMLGDATPVMDNIGDGGLERWVAYPVVMWLAAFGGYLMVKPSD